MSGDFWYTVLGQRLANVLIRDLPKLTEKRKQGVYKIAENEDREEVIRALIDNGHRIVTVDNDIVIFE